MVRFDNNKNHRRWRRWYQMCSIEMGIAKIGENLLNCNEKASKGNWKIDGLVNVSLSKCMYARPRLKSRFTHFIKEPIETALNHGLIYPIATSLNSWSFHISLIFFNEEILFYWFGLFSEHQASHKNVFERVWNNEHTANNVEKWTPHTETQSKSKYKLLHKQMPYNVRVQWHFRFSSFHYTDFVCCHHTRKLSNIYSMNLLLNCLHNAAVSILSPKERERDRAFIPIPC